MLLNQHAPHSNLCIYRFTNGDLGISRYPSVDSRAGGGQIWKGSPHFLAMDRSILLVGVANALREGALLWLTVLAALRFHSRIPFSSSFSLSCICKWPVVERMCASSTKTERQHKKVCDITYSDAWLTFFPWLRSPACISNL